MSAQAVHRRRCRPASGGRAGDVRGRAFSKFEPVLQELELKPSECIRRQVRFTPFPFEDTAWLIEQCGPELFMFTTDYPHPEGGRRPFEIFGAALAGFGDAARDQFFWRSGAEHFGLA